MLLLDTNVLSELRKVRHPRTDPRFVAWANRSDSQLFRIPAIVIYELHRGVLLKERKDAPQGAVLRNWLTNVVLKPWSDRIEPITSEISLEAAKLTIPEERNAADALVAATAIVLRMPLATRNTNDFVDLGIPLINPWEA